MLKDHLLILAAKLLTDERPATEAGLGPTERAELAEVADRIRATRTRYAPTIDQYVSGEDSSARRALMAELRAIETPLLDLGHSLYPDDIPSREERVAERAEARMRGGRH